MKGEWGGCDGGWGVVSGLKHSKSSAVPLVRDF